MPTTITTSAAGVTENTAGDGQATAVQPETPQSAVQKSNEAETKGHHSHDKETPVIQGSVAIMGGLGLPSSNSSADRVAEEVSSVAVVTVLMAFVAVAMLTFTALAAVVVCVVCVRRSSRSNKGRAQPLTEEEVVESMKKNGFVNPTYTFFAK